MSPIEKPEQKLPSAEYTGQYASYFQYSPGELRVTVDSWGLYFS